MVRIDGNQTEPVPWYWGFCQGEIQGESFGGKVSQRLIVPTGIVKLLSQAHYRGGKFKTSTWAMQVVVSGRRRRSEPSVRL